MGYNGTAFKFYIGYFLDPNDRRKFTVLGAMTDWTAALALTDGERKIMGGLVECLTDREVEGRELVGPYGSRITPQ